jgi:hypothetical protein
VFDVHMSRIRCWGSGHEVLLLVVVHRASAYVVGLFTAEETGNRRYRLRERATAYRRVAELALLRLRLGTADPTFGEPVSVTASEARL